MKKRFSSIIIVILLAGGILFAGGEKKELVQSLTQKLAEIKKEVGFPGATLAVVLPGGKEISLALGLADKEKGIPMKPGDRMFTGSVGKTFAAATALQLIEEKKLSLSDKVSKYFKNSKWYDRIPNAPHLTVDMLMHHTSGIPRHVFAREFLNQLPKDPAKTWKPEELLSFIFDKKPVHEAGKGWAYSDTNFIILGMIIEKVTGNIFYKEAQKRLLTPLKLDKTSPAVGREHPGLVSGYTGKEPFGLPEKTASDGKYVIDPQFEWTGGGFVTNSLDLARWAKALYGGDVLKKATRANMLKPLDYNSGKPGKTGYGLGVQVWDSPYGLVYGHGGIFPGYQTYMVYLPKYDLALSIQINSDRTRLAKAKDLYNYFTGFFPILVNHIKTE